MLSIARTELTIYFGNFNNVRVFTETLVYLSWSIHPTF